MASEFGLVVPAENGAIDTASEDQETLQVKGAAHNIMLVHVRVTVRRQINATNVVVLFLFSWCVLNACWVLPDM